MKVYDVKVYDVKVYDVKVYDVRVYDVKVQYMIRASSMPYPLCTGMCLHEERGV